MNLHTTGRTLWELHDADLKSSAAGVRMYDIYDVESMGPGAPEYLTTHQWGTFYLGVSPVQMKIYDRRCVIIEGPPIDGERSTIAVSGHRMLSAAWEYWNFVRSNAMDISLVLSTEPLRGLTSRQREIAYMMADDLTDEAIATRLEVSTRTVRAEIAALMRLLHARSRFGAGLRLGRLGFHHLVVDHSGELQRTKQI